MTATETITRPSLHMELLDRLRSLIIEGELAPGTKVPERELCERYGVSRTPMREALKVLAVDGLVLLEPNRGAWVSKLTIEELEDVFEVMGVLEGLAGEIACKNATDEQIKDIRRTHEDMVRFYESRELGPYFKANQAIHEAILEAANNAELTAVYQPLAARIRRARFLANMTEERWKKAVEEHEQIMDALEGRRGADLGSILKFHLASKLETVRQWLAEKHDAA